MALSSFTSRNFLLSATLRRDTVPSFDAHPFTTRRSHSVLHEFLRLARGPRRRRDGYFLRAESYFNVASEIEALDREPASGPPIIGSYGGRSLHEQSHGESFMALLLHRFGGDGLYLLDEPEAALSPARQLALLARMHALVGQGSQFIIATHSPMLMAYPGAVIFRLDDGAPLPVAWDETNHVRVTRRFLASPREMQAQLLAENPREIC